MKLFMRKDIVEGEVFPDAWLWWGRILPLSKKAPIGFALMLMLPWWARLPSAWYGTDCLHQLCFQLLHFKGHPERYDLFFTPIRLRD